MLLLRNPSMSSPLTLAEERISEVERKQAS